jgi:SAM-dependent methyltransferase
VKPTERFSNRVGNYVKYRPGYPPEVLQTLREYCGLTPGIAIADVGSGTGILTEQFLRNGNRVYAVEPNREMRQAAERLLAAYPNFTSIAAPAEATTLPAAGIDLIAAAQCLHWFDLEAARREFRRILKPRGWGAVIWNDRRDESPFMQDYRQLLLRHATDYRQVDHKLITPEVLRSFYGGEFETRVFDNPQVFDWEGIRGRLLSASYMPLESELMIGELRRIFERHEVDGRVKFDHDTTLYYGRITQD